jgi:hypothetical protein
VFLARAPEHLFGRGRAAAEIGISLLATLARGSVNPAEKNVKLTVAQSPKESSVLRGLKTAGTIEIAGAICNLETAKVEFLT